MPVTYELVEFIILIADWGRSVPDITPTSYAKSISNALIVCKKCEPVSSKKIKIIARINLGFSEDSSWSN